MDGAQRLNISDFLRRVKRISTPFWNSTRDLLPIIGVIVLFQLLVFRQPLDNLGELLLGLVLVVAGLTLFVAGLELGLFPLGEGMAHDFARKGSAPWLLAFAFALGFGTTYAEPALISIAAKAADLAALDERRAYVPAVDVTRAIEHAPNQTWKLLIALSRFAGLLVPSEALSLRWQDVDWERQRLTVPSPKTQHLAGRGYRVIPLFPTVRSYLEEAWDLAPEGAEYVIPEEYRRRAHGPAGWANANLRTRFEKIIRRAGLEPWPRLWHSMRASCETDLARQFPLAIVAKWLGNTQAVAMRHYVDVTDADFERAVDGNLLSEQVAQKAAQQAHAPGSSESQTKGPARKKSRSSRGSATSRTTLQTPGMEAAGIEPASRDISAGASTCVVGSFTRLDRRPLTDEVPGRPAGNFFSRGRAQQ